MTPNFVEVQHQTIDMLVGLLSTYPEVECAFLMGSHAKGEASAYSDIDVAVVFTEKTRPKRQEIFEGIAVLHPVLSWLWLFDQQGLFLYENGVRLDVDFLMREELETWNLAGTKIIYGSSTWYQQKAQHDSNITEPVEKPKWTDDNGDMIDWFFWMFRQVYCWTLRGESNFERRFEKLNSALASLQTTRDKLLDMVVYLNGVWDYLNNIDKKLADELASTYSDMDTNNIKDSTRRLFEVFVVVGKRYCERVGKTFPAEKVITMRNLFDEFDRALDEEVKTSF